jgi:hypothetical protein
VDLVEAFRSQAFACERLGSAMYGELLGLVADDIAAGGPARDVLRGHEDDPGPSGLALRLAGSVHRLVLERRAGALAAFYPSVGGSWDPDAGWPHFRAVLADQPDAVREWLDRPPQTNEVGRAAGLMAGLLVLGGEHAHPVRLVEIGSSGGLNLLADQFRYVGPAGSLGPASSPVVLDPAWEGRVPEGQPAAIVERWGSDVMPVDARRTEGRLALTAYVWPDQVHRHERLRGALALAQRTPYEVRRQPAAECVEALTLRAGTVTVLWHSVMWQYLSREEQTRIRARLDELGASASPEMPLAHVYVEPTRRTPESSHEFLVCLESWSGDAVADGVRRILGKVAPHGLPVTWE